MQHTADSYEECTESAICCHLILGRFNREVHNQLNPYCCRVFSHFISRRLIIEPLSRSTVKSGSHSGYCDYCRCIIVFFYHINLTAKRIWGYFFIVLFVSEKNKMSLQSVIRFFYWLELCASELNLSYQAFKKIIK